MLREGRWLPARTPVDVVVLPPEGNDWSAALRLRDHVRAAMLAACGEPDLGLDARG